MSIEKHRAVALLKSIETGDKAAASVIDPDVYIQHNLNVGDGPAGFTDLLKALPEGAAKVDTVRVFADKDYVFAHSEYEFFGPKVSFDIFRFDNGLIVEHWDNLQETPSRSNPSERTMIDGPITATDLHKTDENKALVEAFVNDILVNERMDNLAAYFDGDKYLQHNPQIGDGLSGLSAALDAMTDAGVTMGYDRVHKVLGEGSFVLVVSEGYFADEHTSFYDLFRVRDGKIAEHWDTNQRIPPRSDWKNDNGKFGFP